MRRKSERERARADVSIGGVQSDRRVFIRHSVEEHSYSRQCGGCSLELRWSIIREAAVALHLERKFGF